MSELRRAIVPALIALLAGCAGHETEPVDLLIRGGTVVDGTGAPPLPADVAVRDGRIVSIGSSHGLSAEREIDATGLIVAPGFVDLHSHADLILLADSETRRRLLRAKIAQGVTTILVGNCGLGVAPSTAEAAAILGDVNGWMTPSGVAAPALTVDDYLTQLERQGVPLNVGTLVPHGPLRISAMGLSWGEPTEAQLATMQRQLERALEAGAFGLSSGLIYPPGMYSDTDELVALASTVARHDRLFTAHVRGSSETLLRSTEELIEIARRSGARTHHSHLEAVGDRFWPRIGDVLALEDRARDEGLRISHDVFPYTRAATMMSAIFPPWALEGGVEGLLVRLEDPATRARIRDEIERRSPEWPPWKEGGWPHNLVGAVGWDGILVASVAEDGPADLVGRSLADIAASSGRDPFDVVADLMIGQRGQVGQLVAEISGREDRLEHLLSILTHDAAAVVSDAEDYGRGSPHPAHAGAFVRALRLAREGAQLPLEGIVRKMTAYPASLIGLSDRGVVRVGAAADLVLFAADHVADRAHWTRPRLLATGVRTVLVNGRVVAEKGRAVAPDAGQVLRAR